MRRGLRSPCGQSLEHRLNQKFLDVSKYPDDFVGFADNAARWPRFKVLCLAARKPVTQLCRYRWYR
jgi:hypothetical protein